MSLKSFTQAKFSGKSAYFRKIRKDALLKKLRSSDKKLECCICYEVNVCFDEITHYGHAICKDCMDELPKPFCPMCREEIELSEKAKNKLEEQRINKMMTYHYIRLFRKMDPMTCYFTMARLEISEELNR